MNFTTIDDLHPDYFWGDEGVPETFCPKCGSTDIDYDTELKYHCFCICNVCDHEWELYI